MSNFEPNAIIRGAQLTLVGAGRALQNPQLFRHDHYRQALMAVAIGVTIQVLLAIPVALVRLSLRFFGLFSNLDAVSWDDDVVHFLHTLQNSVLQIPFFVMTLLKHFSPALDEMFMESIQWVDRTYVDKHKSEDPSELRPLFFPALVRYNQERVKAQHASKRTAAERIIGLVRRYGTKAGISLAIYLLSFLPLVGRFVLPAASFYTFRKAVGTQPAVAIFAAGLIVPRHHFIKFLQTYFSSRAMMRELLVPYFSRIHFTSEQKKRWFREREGVLFGFGVGFFLMIKTPLVGVLIYGIAEASAAYLITKITDPPPAPEDTQAVSAFAESQTTWKTKKDFMSVPLSKLDLLHEKQEKQKIPGLPSTPTRRQFT